MGFLAVRRQAANNRLCLILILVALAWDAFLSGGDGTATNMYIDVDIGLSVASAVIAQSLRQEIGAGGAVQAGFLAISVCVVRIKAATDPALRTAQ